MNIQKLEELIENSDFNRVSKNILIGFLDGANQERIKRSEDRELIEKVYGLKNLSDIVLSNDDVKIFTVSQHSKDQWDKVYPFRSIYKDKNQCWQRTNTVSPTFDVAYLVYLQNKQLGLNSQFVDFAIKMLDIKMPENINDAF